MASEVRLIDANALRKKALWMEMPDNQGINFDVHAVPVLSIDDAPSIDPETLRPKGRWVYDDGELEWACSECLSAAHVNLGAICGYILSDFCPNCGADMREG